MKAVLLGLGGVGTVIAKVLAGTKKFEHVILADLNKDQVNRLSKELGPSFSGKVLDATDVNAMTEVFRTVDLIINVTLPQFNYHIMDAALAARIHYLDLASHGPIRLPGRITVLEQIERYDKKFKDIGKTALLGTGIDPGCSNVFARYLADQMDEVEDVLIRDADASIVEGVNLAVGFSPDTAIEECLQPYLNYEDGQFVQGEPLSWVDEFVFPEPVGKMKIYSVSHEEVGTIPRFLGKPIKNCNFGYALPEEFVNVMRVLKLIGLDSPDPIMVKGVKVAPRDVVTTLLPNPLDLGDKAKGWLCVGTLVRGIKDGKKTAKFMYSMESNEEAFKKYGVFGVSYQTGIPAAMTADMFAEKLIDRVGAFSPEGIDPKPFVERLHRYGLNVEIRDYD